jgi:hypothetical protein
MKDWKLYTLGIFFIMILILTFIDLTGNFTNNSFDDIFTVLNKTYIQEYPNVTNNGNQPSTNLMNQIVNIYKNFNSTYPECPKIIYLCHVYIMKIETDISNIQSPSYTDDWGISQINFNTYNYFKTIFISDMIKHANKYKKYPYISQLILNSDNLNDLQLNITFSLWYAYQLYKDNNGNIRNVISKYNSGKDSDFPKLPAITQNYLKKFDYYFAMNMSTIYNFKK